jgi:hypothetical protein
MNVYIVYDDADMIEVMTLLLDAADSLLAVPKVFPEAA